MDSEIIMLSNFKFGKIELYQVIFINVHLKILGNFYAKFEQFFRQTVFVTPLASLYVDSYMDTIGSIEQIAKKEIYVCYMRVTIT